MGDTIPLTSVGLDFKSVFMLAAVLAIVQVGSEMLKPYVNNVVNSATTLASDATGLGSAATTETAPSEEDV